MSWVPLDIPEKFRDYAMSRNADVRVEHFWASEVDGEWYPESWHITLYREKKLPDDTFWVRCIQIPDDIEDREPLWVPELDLLDAAWEHDMEKAS